jgi:tetratricopeptide (TPR) repeat protein
MWKGLFEQFIRKVFAVSEEDRIALRTELADAESQLQRLSASDSPDRFEVEQQLELIRQITMIRTRFEEYPEQLPFLDRALKMREKLLDSAPDFDADRDDFIAQLMHYAFVLDELGKKDRATEMRSRARELRAELRL